jgi:predicted alpha/beta superfamily hydrolase
MLLAFGGGSANAQMTISVTAVPQLTPLLDDLYVSGPFNGWDAGDPQYRLNPVAGGTYEVQIPGTTGETVEYKFTRGSWSKPEGTAEGYISANRTLLFQQGGTAEVAIAGWEDIPGNHTVTAGVRLLDTDFAIPELGRTRRIWVMLPDDYDTSENHYPVWYLHDGQNLFDAATSFAGEWGLDEYLHGSSAPPCRSILIGIDNGGMHRTDEYAPWINSQYNAGGQGGAYAAFVVNTLKPFVDGYFRTLPDWEHTCTAGSSLGGLISAFSLLEYPDVFSRAGILSPAFWFNRDEIMELAQNSSLPAGTHVYMIAGQNESATMASHMNEMRDLLIASGVPAQQVTAVADPSGAHNEAYWGQAFPAVYDALASCIPEHIGGTVSPGDLTLFPNPARDTVTIRVAEGSLSRIRLLNTAGQFVSDRALRGSAMTEQIDISGIPAGYYRAEVTYRLAGGPESVRMLSFVKN